MRLSEGQLVGRFAIWSCVLGATVGVVWGLVESIAEYPPSSWAAVTAYLAMLCAIGATILGLIAVGLVLLVRPRRR